MRVALALWPSLLVVAALLLLGAEGRGLASGRQAAKVLSAEGAQGYNLPTRDTDGYTLYYNLRVTDAQIEAARKALSVPSNVLDSDFTFWHWTTWQTCIRRSIKGVDQGEIDYLINHDDGMRVGGGLYIARNPESSSAYGPCPLEITLKQGTPKYDAAILAAAGIKIGMDRQKAGLGTIIKFVHYYDTGENWWVTHSAGNIKSVEVGFKDWPSIPWWDKAASTPYAIRPRALTFIELWNLIEGSGGIRESIAKDLGMGEGSQGFNSLSWLKSFYILMQYIDGPSLVRAIRAFQNPWDAFEPQNFGGYMKAWTSFLDARIAKPDGSPIDAAGFHYGIASKGKFGEGTASAWAKRQRDESVLKLCKLVSGGRGDCTYRWDVVRAGGDEAGRTFKATPGQVAAMYRNPYLVVNAARQDDGNYLVYYYYPDPTHLNPSLQPRVSFNLWYVMTHTNYTESPELLKVHGSQLISELMLEMFTRHYGRPVDQGSPFQTGPGGDLNGLTMILDMVSIHPFTDFNGRTTRFYLTAAQIESAYLDNWWKFGDTPAAFISDFDLVTDFTTYQKQVVQATGAVNKLRIEMLAEWVRGLKTGMPKHFDLPAWGRFVDDALGWARGKTHVEFDESDFPLIEKRRFVDLLDKKLGTNWPSRNS